MLKNCTVCGGALAADAKSCPKCHTEDPFGEKKRAKKNARVIGLIGFVGGVIVCLYYLNKLGVFHNIS